MDRKSIIVLVLCFVLLMLWYPLVVNKLYPPKPVPRRDTNAVPAEVVASNQVTSAATSAPPVLETPLARPPVAAVVQSNMPEQLVELTNAHAHYTFTSYGGGLKNVELIEYPETVSKRRSRKGDSSRVATLNTAAPVPAMAVLGSEAVQGDGIFNLTSTASGVRAEKVLSNGLAIVKTFELSTNYLLIANVRLENRSSIPLALPPQNWVCGTATPMSPQDDGQAVGAMWYDGAKSHDLSAGWFANRTLGCLPGTPRTEFQGGASNVWWVAAHNQFFALAAVPKEPALQVQVHQVPLPKPSAEEVQASSRTVAAPVGYQASMVYPAVNLAPGEAVERHFTLFTGPKEYRTLAAIAARFGNELDTIMGFGGFFGFFSKGLLLGMNWLHHSLRLPYGWAIIAITVIIKLLFWPLTQASTRSMKRMQALQPQMKAIQEKYKDDPVKMNRKVMEFMREHKVSPLGGCMPMLLQMPVFIGFFYMIRSAIELRGANFLWVGDLSQPDTLFMIPGLNFPFNLLPLIMGATMLWQARLTPPSPGMDPTQAKIMRYMPLMFMVFLYNFSAGLTLYWTVQNLLTIAQTKLTRTAPETPGPAKPAVLTPPQKKRK